MTQHPQHSTTRRTPVEPRILTTHRLITKGVSKETGDDFVKAAVEGLQSLACKATAKPLHIAPAPTRRSVQELLSQASQTAKAFTVKRALLPAGKEVA